MPDSLKLAAGQAGDNNVKPIAAPGTTSADPAGPSVWNVVFGANQWRAIKWLFGVEEVPASDKPGLIEQLMKLFKWIAIALIVGLVIWIVYKFTRK